jgi:uncharacterized protein YbjT (DUF2867 family)
MKILVTGGTGSLGRPTVTLLKAAGHDVRILSRRNGQDLSTGAGLAEAFEGVDTVLHLASAANAKDIAQTQNTLDAARAAGVSHFAYISIVGVDVVPYPYYRAKFACEQLIEKSGIPFTILRATQFHSFIAMLIAMQRRLPVILAVDVPDQPVAVEEVAERLAELIEAGPSGRVADVGGPEQLRLREAIATWQRAGGTRKPVWMIPFIGKTIRAFKEGRHMTPLPGFGRETFAEFAAREAR